MVKVLDLFCGAGGAAKGYADLGFEVIGIDIAPQPHYPYEFIKADALRPPVNLEAFDLIHASPPCQAYSKTRQFHPHITYPRLVEPILAMLARIEIPWVVENVPESPLKDLLLCGAMFGLRTYRHRYFDSNFHITQPPHPSHLKRTTKLGRAPASDEFMTIAGHFSGIKIARKIMKISWMTRDELSEAIPPIYTSYIGQQFLAL
jgi:DNA (cytosine-5)-methyltransferase 1